MSCFICDNRTIEATVVMAGQLGLKAPINDYESSGTPVIGNENQIGSALLDMNDRAFEARYPSENNELKQRFELSGLPAPRFDNADSSAQYIKAAECLLYQCSEGDVMASDLYKWLDALIKTAMAHFVHATESYMKAQWDWSEDSPKPSDNEFMDLLD